MNYNYNKNNLNFILFYHDIFYYYQLLQYIYHFIKPNNNKNQKINIPLQNKPN